MEIQNQLQVTHRIGVFLSQYNLLSIYIRFGLKRCALLFCLNECHRFFCLLYHCIMIIWVMSHRNEWPFISWYTVNFIEDGSVRTTESFRYITIWAEPSTIWLFRFFVMYGNPLKMNLLYLKFTVRNFCLQSM